MYEVKLTSRAQRDVDELSPINWDRVQVVLDRLSINPRPPGIRKILGNICRIRIGDWRVIYAVFDRNNLILVGRIARRSEDTYNKVKGLILTLNRGTLWTFLSGGLRKMRSYIKK
tara:strand:- start:2043 stop:2387 length:345 start_codon:yes stop_codon:yes gene_type:complete